MSFRSFGACRNGDICACARYLCYSAGGLSDDAKANCSNPEWVKGVERDLERRATRDVMNLPVSKGSDLAVIYTFRDNYTLPDQRANYVQRHARDFCKNPPTNPDALFEMAPNPKTYVDPEANPKFSLLEEILETILFEPIENVLVFAENAWDYVQKGVEIFNSVVGEIVFPVANQEYVDADSYRYALQYVNLGNFNSIYNASSIAEYKLNFGGSYNFCFGLPNTIFSTMPITTPNVKPILRPLPLMR